MVLPIIGIVITFVLFIFSNIVAWVLLILQITPNWTIWLAGIANFVFGYIAMATIQRLKEEIADRWVDNAFLEEEQRQKEKK